MKITPLEIRQKSFEKKLRGYDKDEVTAFLQSLSHEWEQVQDEVKELRLRYDAAEKEIKQLREVENSLFKTLKTAEDTGANMIDQATKTADLHLRETQMNADALLNEAKSKARSSIDEAESKARNVLDKMDQDLQSLKMEYRGLENLRDIIITELRNLSTNTLQRVDKIEAKAAMDAAVVKARMGESVQLEPEPELARKTKKVSDTDTNQKTAAPEVNDEVAEPAEPEMSKEKPNNAIEWEKSEGQESDDSENADALSMEFSEEEKEDDNVESKDENDEEKSFFDQI